MNKFELILKDNAHKNPSWKDLVSAITNWEKSYADLKEKVTSNITERLQSFQCDGVTILLHGHPSAILPGTENGLKIILGKIKNESNVVIRNIYGETFILTHIDERKIHLTFNRL